MGRHRDRIVTTRHGLPGREQSDNEEVRPYESGVDRGEMLGNRSDLCKDIRRSVVDGVNLFVVRIAATSPCRESEIIPVTSSRVCCGDDASDFSCRDERPSLIVSFTCFSFNL